MPLPQKWNKNKARKAPPDGFDTIEPILEALENELRDKIRENNINQRKNESLWPVHQINWQRTRYVYDMYYTYKRISKTVYQYCIDQKLIDAGLIAKWKKPGYERLCSTYVINPSNYKFNTVSICRVPYKNRTPDQRNAKDPTTGCMGCASGKDAGPRNIFGNKYGQNLAAVQIAREKRMELKQLKKEQQEQLQLQRAEEERRNKYMQQQKQQQMQQEEDQQQDDNDDNDDNDGNDDNDDDDGNDETDDDDDVNEERDDDDDDDYGPTPAAGIWAGSKKLQQESDTIAYNSGNEGNDDDDENNQNNDRSCNNNHQNKFNDNDDDDGEKETDDDDEDDDKYQSTPSKKIRVDK